MAGGGETPPQPAGEDAGAVRGAASALALVVVSHHFVVMPGLFCQIAYHFCRKSRRLAGGLMAGWWLVSALPSPAASDHFLVDVWDREAGMPSSSITSLAQTPEGYIWIGTYNGLVRFDGVRFVSFDPFNTPELEHEHVRYLYTDGEGTLWINTFNGSMTTWRNGVFTRETNWPSGLGEMIGSHSNQVLFATSSSVLERQGGPGEPGHWRTIKAEGGLLGHVACEDGAGEIWYVTADHGLGRVRGDASELIQDGSGLPADRVNCLAVDPAGHLWVGTEAGLARWADDHFENQTPPDPKPLGVTFLTFNQRGDCWVYANGHLRLCRDRAWVAEATAWQDLPKASAPTISAHRDAAGNTWFCHYGNGMLWVGTNGVMRTVTGGDGLPGNRIICWLQDHEGNVWVGADHGGLARIRERQFNVINPGNDAVSKVAMTVCEDAQGAVWMGSSGGGLTRWLDGATTRYPLASLENKGLVFSMYPDAQPGSFWLSADNEDLCHFDNGEITRPEWSVHGVKSILRDRSGRLWLGMRDGLACYADGSLKHLGAREGFRRTDVRALAQDKEGTVWAGTGNGRLYRFGPPGDNSGAVATGEAYRVPDRWGGQPIWSLYADPQGTIWVGTFRGGLLRFKNGQFTRFMAAQGLPNDVICQILPDHQGNLWLGSYGGIFRASRVDLNAYAEGRADSVAWVTYGRLDGLPTLECSGGYQPSAWQGNDGRLWFATLKGLVSVQPRGMINDRPVPAVILEEVVADGKVVARPVQTAQLAGIGRANVVIGPGKHYVEFRFTGLSFSAPEQVRFRYRLRELDNLWVEAGTRRSAQYSFLRPGDYHFEVSACNNEGLWNPTVASLTLRIEPHLWETWWFLLGLGIFLAGGVALVARTLFTRKLRRQMELLEQQQAVERDRARIARDIHDDLGAGLTQIALLTELTRRASPEALPGRLNQISETARELTGAMDEIVWAVNPQNDTLDGFAIYLCKFGQEYLSVAGIRCRLDVPVQLPSVALPAETRHHLFLAVKETLHNIVKHAQASEVWLKLSVSEAGLTVVVQDNGRGFGDGSANGGMPVIGRLASGNGLPNLAQRLATIGGQACLTSGQGGGVRVELTAPFVPPASPQMVICSLGPASPCSPVSLRA